MDTPLDKEEAPVRWDHAFDFPFVAIVSDDEDAEDVTGAQLREKMKEYMNSVSDAQLLADCVWLDTMEEGT